MAYTVYLTSSAIADVTLAKDYYNSKSAGLGKRMAIEVDLTLTKIQLCPKHIQRGIAIFVQQKLIPFHTWSIIK